MSYSDFLFTRTYLKEASNYWITDRPTQEVELRVITFVGVGDLPKRAEKN